MSIWKRLLWGSTQYTMTDKQRASWERKRRHGQGYYVFVYGIATYGSFYFALVSCWHFWHHPQFDWKTIFFYAIFCAIGGSIFGMMNWHSAELNYQREKTLSILDRSTEAK